MDELACEGNKSINDSTRLIISLIWAADIYLEQGLENSDHVKQIGATSGLDLIFEN